jgi:uncharacterized coiled-coil DUF342 family protein
MLDVIDIAQALGGLSASVQKMEQLAQEYRRLVQVVEELTRENRQLKEQFATVKAERDELEMALRFQSRRETAFTLEDLQEMEQSGLGARELLALLQDLEPGAHDNTP